MGRQAIVGGVVFALVLGLVMRSPEGASLATAGLVIVGIGSIAFVVGLVRPATPGAAGWVQWVRGHRGRLVAPVLGLVLATVLGSMMASERAEAAQRTAEASAAQKVLTQKKAAEALAARKAAMGAVLSGLSPSRLAELDAQIAAMEQAVKHGDWAAADAPREAVAKALRPLADGPVPGLPSHPAFDLAKRFVRAEAALVHAEQELLPGMVAAISKRGELLPDEDSHLKTYARKVNLPVSFIRGVDARHTLELHNLIRAQRNAFDSEIFEYLYAHIWSGPEDEPAPAVRKAARKFNVSEDRIWEIITAKQGEITRREKAKKAKEHAAMEKSCGPVPDDGGAKAVRHYLRRALNDPDSLEMGECSELLYYVGKCYEVKCSYRGKNGFGALVLNASTFRIQFGEVVDVKQLR